MLRKARRDEFTAVRQFYWDLIDSMKDRTDTVAWKKGIYPSDRFLKESCERGELYILNDYEACVILNSASNDGYKGIAWGVECRDEEVLIPHALAVRADLQGKGTGKTVVREILALAKSMGKKTVRLDLLCGNIAAERLYTGIGFRHVETKTMFYEDTGWTDFAMYEWIL